MSIFSTDPAYPQTLPIQGAPAVDYGYLRHIVFEQSQNVLDPSRDYLFDTRLVRVLRSQGLTHMQDLVRLLRERKDPGLERSIAEAMTINETSFFRDSRPFELLRSELLPALIESRRAQRTLRLWSAACSTGQEAYSMAMLLLEHYPQIAGITAGSTAGPTAGLNTGSAASSANNATGVWDVRIEGTDISSEVVHRSQTGTYHRIEMNRGLPARNIVRFFDHHGEDWTVKPEVRRLCNFRQANLCASQLPFTPSLRFDVIFLRNVMLYFAQDTRRKLLAHIHRQLAPDGVLFLGSSEQPVDMSLWTPVLSGGTCYYRPRQLS